MLETHFLATWKTETVNYPEKFLIDYTGKILEGSSGSP